MQQTCDKCGGKGVTYKTKCPVCDGNKVRVCVFVSERARGSLVGSEM